MTGLKVLFRDDRLLAVHKPAGIHVHPSPFDRGEPSLVDLVEAELGVKPYPVHRLDRPTSGVLLFALDPQAASSLSTAFRDRRVDKVYWAVVRGWMPPSHATFDVQLDVKLPERTDAETWFQPLENYEAPWPRRGFETFRFGLVEAKPVTGRRHQIRQHCDDLRHPIFGDTVWGDTGLNGWLGTELARFGRELGGLHLWCRRLTFPHPDGLLMTVEAPLWPEEEKKRTWYQTYQVPLGVEG